MPSKDKEKIAARRVTYRLEVATAAGKTRNAYRRDTRPLYYGLHRLVAHARRRCKASGAMFNMRAADLRALLVKQKGLCALSKQPLQFGRGDNMYKASVDRIIPVLGYVPGNLRLVCWWVNIARYHLTDREFRKWCRRIVDV